MHKVTFTCTCEHKAQKHLSLKGCHMNTTQQQKVRWAQMQSYRTRASWEQAHVASTWPSVFGNCARKALSPSALPVVPVELQHPHTLVQGAAVPGSLPQERISRHTPEMESFKGFLLPPQPASRQLRKQYFKKIASLINICNKADPKDMLFLKKCSTNSEFS